VPDRAPAQLKRLLLTLLLATPVTLLLATAGGCWLAARAMRPVRTISNMARGIGETDLSRRLNLPDRDELGELEVVGDPLSLTQMLSNIIENAIHYTSGQGHSVLIEAGARTGDGQSQGWVRVSDDGPGIAAVHLPHLFERFYRVDQAREHFANEDGRPVDPSGSGLGLSIARWVAITHGGDVHVASAVGHGTTVEVWLPLVGETVTEWPAQPAPTGREGDPEGLSVRLIP
jgi:signal transduction histidine kinase